MSSPEDPEVISLEWEKKKRKKKELLSGVPATKADLEILLDRLSLIEEDQDKLEKLFLRLLRLLKKELKDMEP